MIGDQLSHVCDKRCAGLIIGNLLRNHCECEIVSVAAFVAGLKIVAVYINNGAVGQVTEGAADGIS